MGNLIDYVLWRGDIPVHQVPLGEADALVLSYLSYMPFDGFVSAGFEQGTLLGDAAAYLAEHGLKSVCTIDSAREDCRLLRAIAESERFALMRVVGYESRYDEEREEQFAAVTFLPPHGPAFIAFRGTDGTVVGRKEDFNLSFETAVPAQKSAAAYVLRAAQALPGAMILGGHSKGGNLAAYAAVFSPEDVRRRIACVYNFDGPGFNENVIALPEFRESVMKIHTFVPQSSMVGVLLWHAEPFTVVQSSAPGLFQHNPYTWQIMGGRLIRLPERTRESRLAEETIKHWLMTLSTDSRRQIIDGIYGVLSASDGRNIADLFEARNVRAILRAASEMDEETKDAIVDAFRRLGGSLKETLPDWIDRTAGEIRAMIGQKKNQDNREENG